MCPPGVDQTMRLSQYWRFLAPELRQTEEFKCEHDYNRNELATTFSKPNHSWDAWSKLARPIIPSTSIAQTSRRQQNSPASTLDVLSTELLDMITSYLTPVPTDLIAFGLTSERFWALVNRDIHTQYPKPCAPWAGTKLAFQGSYSTDLPAPFEENDLQLSIIGAPETWFGRKCAARRFFGAHYSFDTPLSAKSLHGTYLEAMENWKDESNIPKTKWDGMKAELEPEDFFPQDRVWVLRNLTTREVITTERPFTRSKSLRHRYRLEELLLMRICWTDIPSQGDKSLGVGRGVWAGHAFEILCAEEHGKEGGEWRDVTDVVEAEAREVRRTAKKLVRKQQR